AAGDPSYRTVKGILAAGTDTAPLAAQPATARAVPALLHGPAALVGDLETPLLADDHDNAKGAGR
ncbi:MAG TPA: IS21 family transposase, partial [Actinomycetes bacterium]|nr:IS21 family transposase [Actinomycetes bacterium]